MTDLSAPTSDIEEVRAHVERWEKFENTGDESLVEDLIAEDMVWMPPNGDLITGIEASRELLADLNPTERFEEVRHTNNEFVVSDDLIVNFMSKVAIISPSADAPSKEVPNHVITVYERQEDGSWKVRMSMWNVEES